MTSASSLKPGIVTPGMSMAGRMNDAEWSASFGVALEDQLEDAAVEGVVPRLVLGDVAQHLGQPRLVLAHDPAGLAVGELGRPLLHRGVGEDPVRIPVPLRVEPGADILELHLLDLALVEQAGVAGVVVEHLAVPVLLGGPEIVPGAPVALVAQVHGEEPVEVGQPFFGQHVERERRPDRIGDAARPGPAGLPSEFVGAAVGLRARAGRRGTRARACARGLSMSSRTGSSRSLSTSIFDASSRAESVAMPMCSLLRR